MKVSELKDILDRELFRPFAMRLNNGILYAFNTRKDFGASKDYEMIFHFGDHGGAARIDAESIVEIIETK